jgi:hypothetical protein
METLEQTLWVIRNWSIDRVHTIIDESSTDVVRSDKLVDAVDDAYSIQQEFAEWLNPDIDDHDVVSLEYLGDEDGRNI